MFRAQNWSSSLRSKIGCWFHERWRAECAMHSALSRATGIRWPDLCNRHENLALGNDPESRECLWPDSSTLTVARQFPSVGGRLLKHCLKDWPVDSIGMTPDMSNPPIISVVIPVGGADRLRTFPVVLQSMLKQKKVRPEVIVVEHAEESLFRAGCAAPVRYVHLKRSSSAGFNKSACLNAGVREAGADIVVLHDADVVVPENYLANIVNRIRSGYEAVRPIRFLFYLDQGESEHFVAENVLPDRLSFVQQNNPGLSTAILRDTYWDIGGHNEQFEGWGGEDLEFLDRLKTKKLFRGSYAPALHLWHPAAPKKASGDRNMELLNRLRTLDPMDRIRQLTRHL